MTAKSAKLKKDSILEKKKRVVGVKRIAKKAAAKKAAAKKTAAKKTAAKKAAAKKTAAKKAAAKKAAAKKSTAKKPAAKKAAAKKAAAKKRAAKKPAAKKAAAKKRAAKKRPLIIPVTDRPIKPTVIQKPKLIPSEIEELFNKVGRIEGEREMVEKQKMIDFALTELGLPQDPISRQATIDSIITSLPKDNVLIRMHEPDMSHQEKREMIEGLTADEKLALIAIYMRNISLFGNANLYHTLFSPGKYDWPMMLDYDDGTPGFDGTEFEPAWNDDELF